MGGEFFPSTAFNLEPLLDELPRQSRPRAVQPPPARLRAPRRSACSPGCAAGRARSAHIRGAFAAMMAMLAVQVVLGIVTVMHGAPLAARDRAPARRGRALHADRPRPLRRALSAGAADRPRLMQLRLAIPVRCLPGELSGPAGARAARCGGALRQMAATAVDLRPGGTVSGPTIFALPTAPSAGAPRADRPPGPGGDRRRRHRLPAQARRPASSAPRPEVFKLGRTLAVGDVLHLLRGESRPGRPRGPDLSIRPAAADRCSAARHRALRRSAVAILAGNPRTRRALRAGAGDSLRAPEADRRDRGHRPRPHWGILIPYFQR